MATAQWPHKQARQHEHTKLASVLTARSGRNRSRYLPDFSRMAPRRRAEGQPSLHYFLHTCVHLVESVRLKSYCPTPLCLTHRGCCFRLCCRGHEGTTAPPRTSLRVAERVSPRLASQQTGHAHLPSSLLELVSECLQLLVVICRGSSRAPTRPAKTIL